MTTDQHDADVVVVGAGLAGLAAANAVVRANRSVVVLEAGDGIGGRVRTDMVEGFRLDRGFQVVLDAYPELHRQLDVDALQLKRFDPGALVWKGGRTYVVGDPLRRPKSIVATARAPIGTLADKARLAFARRRWMHEPVPSLLRQNDGSTRDELRRRGFSDNIVEAFFRPLLGGIQLDPQLAGSVRMADTVMAMLTRGSAAIPANGMGEIANQLGASLPAGSVRINACVGTVENTTAILVSGERVSGRALIVATEGPAAARLIGVRDPASKAVGCVYFDAPAAPIPQRLIVLDGDSSGPALNVAVTTNIAPSLAPPGRHLVVAATPGDIGEGLAERVRSQLRLWFGVSVDRWRELAVYRIAHGQPSDTVPFFPKRVVALGQGLFVCGDHRDTPSIQGALYSGRRTGDAAIGFLTTLTNVAKKVP